MKHYKSVLTIAGSDSGGGAGIQADLKTFSALGCYGTSAITAVTIQNTLGVQGIHAVPPEVVRAQIAAVMSDIQPSAVKIGMVHSAELAEIIALELANYPEVPVVFDPVMVATSGDKLIQDGTIEALKRFLFPRLSLLTPNIPEAEILSGQSISSTNDMVSVAKVIIGEGANAVLLKGGHLNGTHTFDYYCAAEGTVVEHRHPRVLTNNTHGTGCTLSSAVAAFLSRGEELPLAVEKGVRYVHEAIKAGAEVSVGSGHGPLNHFFAPEVAIIA